MIHSSLYKKNCNSRKGIGKVWEGSYNKNEKNKKCLYKKNV